MKNSRVVRFRFYFLAKFIGEVWKQTRYNEFTFVSLVAGRRDLYVSKTENKKNSENNRRILKRNGFIRPEHIGPDWNKNLPLATAFFGRAF